MKRCCIILAGSDDRIHLLRECVECLKKSRYNGVDTYLFYQGVQYKDDPCMKYFTDIMWDSRLRGVFTPRYELMKRFCLEYDFTILIDDDLFMYPDTSYERSMDFCDFQQRAGAVAILHNIKKGLKNEMRCVSGTRQYFNVCGGLVFPKRSIQIILDYFKDKEQDYTEDVVWLLLYVKGYDLYKDFSSSAMHKANRKGKGGMLTGYNKMRVERPHVPMLTEWFDSKQEMLQDGSVVWKLKEMTDINQDGIEERKRNYDSN